MILGGPHNLIQTIYDDQLMSLEAVVIDEATGKIAVCSSKNVHIYKPYGKKEGALKVELKMTCPAPSFLILTTSIVVITNLVTGPESRQWNTDTIMGVGGRAVNWFLFSKTLRDCRGLYLDLESESPQACQDCKLLLRR